MALSLLPSLSSISRLGTHWYHAHSGVQIADGLFGNLIVLHDPVTERILYGDLYDVDEPDEVMLLGDWCVYCI